MKQIIVFLLALLLPAVYLGAQDKDAIFTDSVMPLYEVTVLGNRYREVIPAQTLKGQELERLSALSVADAMRYFSGVQVKDYGGIGGLKTVDVRSLGTNHTAVFYDGIQLGNAQNGQVDLGRFSLDNLEEISLYNGQKSEIFQSAKDFASGAAVYLRSRRPRFSEGKNYNVLGGFRTGSFDLINPSLLWEQAIAPDISFSLNGEYLDSSGKYRYRYKRVAGGEVVQDTTSTRLNGDVESFRLEAGLDGRLNKAWWNAKVYYYNSERGIPGPIVNNMWDDKYHQRQWDRNFFAQGSFYKGWADNYEMKFSGKFTRDYMRYNSDTTDERSVVNIFRQKEVYLSLVNKYTPQPGWDVSLSVDYLWNDLEATGVFNFKGAKRHSLYASLATSYQWKSLKIMGNLLGNFVRDERNYPTRKTEDRSEYSPAVYLSYTPLPDEELTFRLFAKRVFRMPTFNELYYAEVPSILKPETATQYNLGAQWKVEPLAGLALELKADAYYNEVSDKLVALANKASLARWTMTNIGKVKIRGIDLSAKAIYDDPLGVQWRLNLQYTYQRAQDYSYPEEKGEERSTWMGQIPYIPRHSGSVVATAVYKTWDINYSFIYVGERYDNSANISENYHQPWYTNDLSVGKSFRHKLFRLRLSAEVNNVLDQQYDVIINYLMPGRNYRFTLRIEI